MGFLAAGLFLFLLFGVLPHIGWWAAAVMAVLVAGAVWLGRRERQ